MKAKRNQEQTSGYMAQRRQILSKNTNFAIQEAYKSLRTNISFSVRGNKCKKFCITSSVAGEGKSITMLNLAISFAQTGQRVLLIDADMRRPSLGKLLIEKTSPGLSNVLAGLCDVMLAVRKNIRPNLDILFSGEIPPNPLELLSSKTMEKMLEELKPLYDYIIVDTPPVTIVSDTCVGCGLCTRVCPFDAIHIVDGIAKVDKEKCKACAKCIAVCPKQLISFIPYQAKEVVSCSSKDKGKDVMKACKVGCIGCMMCKKVCPNDAITVENNIAHIDPEKCTNCGLCAEKCPKKIIL